MSTSPQRLQELDSPPPYYEFQDLLGDDPAFRECLAEARQAARSDVSILITGESGTGKEMLAQAIHGASPRARLPFMGLNVAAIPRELLESELFGYERGAFTGARERGYLGKLEQAQGGTLLLDEMGDMPLELQVKLLRVLQERVFQRLGGTQNVALRARVMVSTHYDLERAVEEGRFRLDLFHRLRVVHLHLPPLRERRGDIPLLVKHHLWHYASRHHRPPIQVAPHVMTELRAYDWPGNVRELANLLEGAVSLLPEGEQLIARTPRLLAEGLRRQQARRGAAPDPGVVLPAGRVVSMEEVERHALVHALRHCDGNITRAAKALGVAKGTLYSKLRRYGLQSRLHEPPRP